jgi:signal transducer and activator of transcription 5B
MKSTTWYSVGHFFCKEALPDRNFTFWEWFHRILLLTQQHLSKLWQKGFVMGFISKPLAEQMLLEKQSGTFLLRFSDSELGGVTIAYVRQPEMYPGQNPSVFMVAPFTTRDLNQRCMADVIFDLTELTTLYPTIPKDSFKDFVTTKAPSSSSGYVNHNLVTRVEGGGAGFMSPHTPAQYYPNAATPGTYEDHGQSFSLDGLETGGMETGDIVNYDNIDIANLLGLQNAQSLDDIMPMAGTNSPFPN